MLHNQPHIRFRSILTKTIHNGSKEKSYPQNCCLPQFRNSLLHLLIFSQTHQNIVHRGEHLTVLTAQFFDLGFIDTVILMRPLCKLI